jgi:hypothetical protein
MGREAAAAVLCASKKCCSFPEAKNEFFFFLISDGGEYLKATAELLFRDLTSFLVCGGVSV